VEEGTSVPTGSPFDRTKPLGSHTTTERTNGRQEQKCMISLKRSDLLVYEKDKETGVRVCLAGNRRLRDRGQASEQQA
jgi:hypothetical protein